MGDRLLGGRHDRVVGSDDDNHDIRHLCAAGTHGCERLMTRRVEERHLAAVLQRHAVRTDVLGNAAGLTGYHVGVADMVEQRGLAVVDMAHDCHDRSTRNEVVLIILLFADRLLHFGTDILRLEAELVGNKVDGLGIQPLVDGNHDADGHQGGDDLRHRDIHHRRQFGNCNELCQLQRLAFLALGLGLGTQAFLDGITLFLAVFRPLLVLALACQPGECLLYLACYRLVIHLQRFLITVAALLAAVLSAGVSAVLVPALLAVLVLLLIGCGIDVDTFLADTDTLLLALAAALTGLLFTFLAPLFLALLLRTGALVERAEVDLAQDVYLRRIQNLLLVLGQEKAVLLLLFHSR